MKYCPDMIRHRYNGSRLQATIMLIVTTVAQPHMFHKRAWFHFCDYATTHVGHFDTENCRIGRNAELVNITTMSGRKTKYAAK